jgi:hypothetical protein
MTIGAMATVLTTRAELDELCCTEECDAPIPSSPIVTSARR